MKRQSRTHTIEFNTKAQAFSLFCFHLSHLEIAARLKIPESTVKAWSAGGKWKTQRQLVLAENLRILDKGLEDARRQHRFNEADMARRLWAAGSLALSRLDLKKPTTQDIKILIELASLLGRRALNMSMHEAMELTVRHNLGDEIQAAMKRVLARRNGEPKAIELASAPA
jgi:hypothetical protein